MAAITETMNSVAAKIRWPLRAKSAGFRVSIAAIAANRRRPLYESTVAPMSEKTNANQCSAEADLGFIQYDISSTPGTASNEIPSDGLTIPPVALASAGRVIE